MLRLFAVTMFTSSCLLFLIQPLLSKYILPWYGGTPAVWTACLLFYQVMLLLGYSYAHLASRWWKFRTQGIVHVALLVASTVFLPVIPAAHWQPDGADGPVWRILAMLAATVGLPFVVLAGNAPLLQSWYIRVAAGRSPYILYAVSNVGSLLALLSYPFLVERLFSSDQQAWLWSAGYLLFLVLLIGCAWLVIRSAGVVGANGSALRSGKASERIARQSHVKSRGQSRNSFAPAKDLSGEQSPGQTVTGPLTRRQSTLWLAWAAAGVTMMMAVSLQLCQNLVTVPFLWVLPLVVYLLSFIVTFSGERWYPRRPLAVAMLLSLGILLFVVSGHVGVGQRVLFTFSAVQQVVLANLALFVVTWVCHGELYRLRPSPAHLTSFYLALATGGALGGIFVGALAPLVLGQAHELYLAMAAVPVLWLVSQLLGPASGSFRKPWRSAEVLVTGSWLLLMVLLGQQAFGTRGQVLFSRRNFFGTVDVTLHDADLPGYRRLVMHHGVTKHGAQYLQGTYQKLPVTYFSPFTGVGLAITAYGVSEGADRPMRVGVVGLGAGTLAAYGRPGDAYRFYEINPAVVDLAGRTFDPADPSVRFTYLEHCQAEVEIVLGDARLQLARELQAAPQGQQFDILVLDAFDSGAVPVHLLTREAFDLYFAHLRRDGVMAVHISNKYLDLGPVVAGAARTLGMESLQMINRRRDFKDRPDLDCDISNRAVWLILYRPGTFARKLREFSQPLAEAAELELVPGTRLLERSRRVWTDQYSSLFDVLR